MRGKLVLSSLLGSSGVEGAALDINRLIGEKQMQSHLYGAHRNRVVKEVTKAGSFCAF